MSKPVWITLILPWLCVLMVSAHPHPDGQGNDHSHPPLLVNVVQPPKLEKVPNVPLVITYQVPSDVQNPGTVMNIPYSPLSPNQQEIPHFPGEAGSMGIIHADAFGEGLPLPWLGFCSRWNPLWKWLGPEFLKNVSNEGLKKFCEIVANGNLTKGETMDKLNEWAGEEGVSEEFKKYVDGKKKEHEMMSSSMHEILANATKFMEDVKAVKGDMGLTKKEEFKKITDLIKKEPWSSLHIAFLARMYAQHSVNKEHHGKNNPWSAPIYPPSGSLYGHSEGAGRMGPMGQMGLFGNNHGPFDGLFGGNNLLFGQGALFGGNPAQPVMDARRNQP